MFDSRSFSTSSFDVRSWLIDEVIAVHVGICTNVIYWPGPTHYRPPKRLFKTAWWKKKKRLVIAGVEVEPLKPFITITPAQLMRSPKARLLRSKHSRAAITPAALIRSKPTYLSLIRS